MTDKKSFGSYIKQKRTEKNYSQKDLAELLFVTEGAVSKWEGGPKLKDTTLKTHVYITSKQNNFGGKTYEKTDFL